MNIEMIECCIDALENQFKSMIEFHSGQSFAETGVKLPNRNNWKECAEAVIKAQRKYLMPKLLKAGCASNALAIIMTAISDHD